MIEGGGISEILVACSLEEDKILNFGLLAHLEKMEFSEFCFRCDGNDGAYCPYITQV